MQVSLINFHFSLVFMERNHPNHTMWLDLFDLVLRILLQWLHETIPATPPVQATAALLCPSVSQMVLLPTSTDAFHVQPYPLDRIICIISPANPRAWSLWQSFIYIMLLPFSSLDRASKRMTSPSSRPGVKASKRCLRALSRWSPGDI
jgi:hypothetical protein